MQPKSYRVFKWVVYALATMLLCALQAMFFSNMRILGLTPFLYPMLPAAVAMFEGTRRGAVFALIFGVLCDLLLPAPFRGFFAIIFPVIAALSGGVAGRLLSRGFLCALIVSSLGLLATGAFRMVVQILAGGRYLGLMAQITLGETLLTLPALLIVLPLYRTVFRRCAADY
ncbi:MAG: hypothetical protein HFF72_01455 [Oscillospiraceae bacterium]|jgi:hypothetical protein|nr:hypothetical protein [Oscillospiraceae bacterium]